MTPEVAIKKRATVEATKVDTSTEAGGAEATPKTAEKVTTEKSRNVASATTINLVSLHAELHSEYVTKGTQRESAVPRLSILLTTLQPTSKRQRSRRAIRFNRSKPGKRSSRSATPKSRTPT
jgi:hypothetical protein